MSRSFTSTLIAALILVSGTTLAADWSQFRGDHRDGTSTETGLLKTWGEDGPPELWRHPIGPGYSGITVVGDRVFTMDADNEGEYLAAFDAGSGKEIWRQEVGALFENDYGNGPRSTPTYSDGVLYVMSSLGQFSARSAETGERIWEHDLQEEFDSPLPNWAFSTSALIVGDSVIVEIGGTEDRTVGAFERTSGELLWTAGSGEIAFSSPVAVPFNGSTQLVFLTKSGLSAVTPEGEPLWASEFAPELGIKPAPPVFVAPDLIFASASYDAGAKVVRLVGEGDSIRAEEVWEHRLMRNHFNGSVEVDGHLCGFDKAFLKCVEASTGKTSWTKRGLGKGSLIRADGKLIALSERGKLVLMEANAAEPVELASHQILTGRSWTQPALSNGRLYLRNGTEMVALDLADRTSDLVDRYTEALGGLEAIRALESVRKTGLYVYNGLEHPIEVVQQRGARSREDIEGLTMWGTETLSGVTAIRAFDGQHAWTGRQGDKLETRAMPEAEAAGFILDASIEGSLVDHAAKGNTVEIVGATTVEGAAAMQVIVTLPNGTSEDWYLDSATLLPIMKTTQVPDSEFKAAMTWYFDDYREVAGVQLPFYVLVEERLFSREYLFDSIEPNVEIPPGSFTQPEGTQADSGS